MDGDGARDKDWLRARGHHLCLTNTIFYGFFFILKGDIFDMLSVSLDNETLTKVHLVFEGKK